MKAWKAIGIVLFCVGLLHIALALYWFWPCWRAMAADGLMASAEKSGDPHRALAFWFLFLGVQLLPLGHLCWWVAARQKTALPSLVGWWLLVQGLAGAFFVPVSGFWLFAALGLWVLIQRQLTRTRARA
jgi:hypothetical protein